MTAKPIIFSGPMVRAILEGRKTQTRRVIKDVPPMPAQQRHPPHEQKHSQPYLDAYCGDKKTEQNPRGMGRYWCWWQVDDRLSSFAFKLPYAPGDLLWVRETWRAQVEWDQFAPRDIPHGSEVQYAADEPLSPWMSRVRSPIHMLRWAARITLRVTDVRVQRLHDISEADAIAEGLKSVTKDGSLTKWGVPDRDGYPGTDNTGWPWQEWKVDPRLAFAALWNDIHHADAWDANPWVAAYTFERVQP